MRHLNYLLSTFVGITLSFSAFAHAQQPWSKVLSSGRAINWSNAGLPATLPDGETTANPWTPPVRTQCGSTIAGGSSGSPVPASTINTAMAACGTGTYVLLGAGYFSVSSGNLAMYAQNGVTLRGSGPQSTYLTLSGSGMISFTQSWGAGSATWSSGYSAGTTSITITAPSGHMLTKGTLLRLQQCDTGYSGSGCTTGASVDNGGLYICGNNVACSNLQMSYNNQSQVQIVYVTGVTGKGPYTVTFSPGIYMPNFSSANSPFVTWQVYSSSESMVAPYGIGIEDMTIYDSLTTANPAIDLEGCYGCWIKGTRIIGNNNDAKGLLVAGKNDLLFSNYLYEEIPSALGSGDGDNIDQAGSDNLILNNICDVGDCLEGQGQDEGDVIAYNYSHNGNTAYYQDVSFQHSAGSSFILDEGNDIGKIDEDDTWGTHTLNSFFRNYITCSDPPYVIPSGGDAVGLQIDNYSRAENAIGNAIGNSARCPNYQAASTTNVIFAVGTKDPLTEASLMRWGNVSVVKQATDTPANSGVRFVSSEVPTSLSGALAAFSNVVPGSNNLPCSFFLPGYTSTTCTAHPNGGTGLNWWKVCTKWSTFPTSCSGTNVQPFPPFGPDVSGGSNVNGYAYSIPAAVAWQYLPVDAAYQNSYRITTSNWSDGTETLTVSGLPNEHHIMGGFQTSGVKAACIPAGAINSEIVMTGSTSTTVSYALASNPGVSCTGTMLFPDVRQFDERVYQADSSTHSAQPAPPTGLVGNVQTNP